MNKLTISLKDHIWGLSENKHVPSTLKPLFYIVMANCRLSWAVWFIIAMDWILYDKSTFPALYFYNPRQGALKGPLLEIFLISLQIDLIACGEFSRDENIEREMMLGWLSKGRLLFVRCTSGHYVLRAWHMLSIKGRKQQSVAHMLRASYQWHLMNPSIDQYELNIATEHHL